MPFGYICTMKRYPDTILNLQFIEGFISAYYQQLSEGLNQRQAYEKLEQTYYYYFDRYRFASYESFRVTIAQFRRNRNK